MSYTFDDVDSGLESLLLDFLGDKICDYSTGRNESHLKYDEAVHPPFHFVF